MTPSDAGTLEKRRVFRTLHERGCFVIPNPWDAGSAKALERLGFRALATTSSGMAWAMGHADNQVAFETVLEHLRSVCDAVGIPVNADLEGGFAVEPERVQANVTAACATPIAGLSIEDSTGDPARPLFEFALAVDRVRAARRGIDASGAGVLLTARSEGFIAGRPDLKETIRRLIAFAEAGADCLYAPGLRALADIREVVAAVSPKPVNVLVGGGFTTVEELAAAGVRRISVGGALARAAWTGFLRAAEKIATEGTFESLDGIVSYDALNRIFSAPPGRTQG